MLKDSGINSVADFAGKKIATSNLHSQWQVATKVVLKKHGVDPDKVTFLELPFASHPDALKSKPDRRGRIARSVDDAVAHVGLCQGAGVGLCRIDSASSRSARGAQSAISCKNNADAIARFAKSMRDSVEYMNADVERAKKNVAAYTGLNISFLKDMPLNVWSYEIDPAKWQAVADMMHEQRRAAEAAQGRRISLRHRQAVCEEVAD